ncbi:MAG: DUF2442 domain-containing protein [Acidobacteria bacterium]|nr:MAG: DUF2442 domain-containing protein [Acidobacteriota bacterium]
MRSSILRDREALAQKVRVTADELAVDLVDGTVSVPVHWYPRLANGSLAERQNWQIIGRGVGIHLPDLDEDIAVEDLLAGRPSGESQSSFQSWLESRQLLAKRLQPPGAPREIRRNRKRVGAPAAEAER